MVSRDKDAGCTGRSEHIELGVQATLRLGTVGGIRWWESHRINVVSQEHHEAFRAVLRKLSGQCLQDGLTLGVGCSCIADEVESGFDPL